MNIKYIDEVNEHLKVLSSSNLEIKKLPNFIDLVIRTINSNHKILIFGNGGSASDSLHFAAELSGKFKKKNRRPLPAISLSENISTITAIGNDFNFDEIYSRQIKAIGHSKDLAIGISTSGKSINVIKGLNTAKKMGLSTASLVGKNYASMSKVSNLFFSVNSHNTARIQEIHIFFIHLICSELDKIF